MTLTAHSSLPCQSPATTIRPGPSAAVGASPSDPDGPVLNTSPGRLQRS